MDMKEELFKKRVDALFDCMEKNRGDDTNMLTWGYPIGLVYHYIMHATGVRIAKDKKLHQNLFRELIEREIEMLKNTLIDVEKKWEEE